MLNFLRQEIAKKEKEQKKAFHAQEAETFSELDEAILECAHLFNEMEELTIIGANAQRERARIFIYGTYALSGVYILVIALLIIYIYSLGDGTNVERGKN